MVLIIGAVKQLSRDIRQLLSRAPTKLPYCPAFAMYGELQSRSRSKNADVWQPLTEFDVNVDPRKNDPLSRSNCGVGGSVGGG